MPFFGKLGPKNQNYHFKLKFRTYTNSNMQNSMMMFIFSVFDYKYPFWAHLFQKVKIISWSWNLGARLIWICRIKWCWSLFLFLNGNILFAQIWSKKSKIISLSWNLVPALIGTWRIQWTCSLFLFLTGNTLFWQIWSKKSNDQFKLKFGT